MLLGCAFVSVWSLYNEMSILRKQVDEFQTFWRRVYVILFYARITQRTLACESEFITVFDSLKLLAVDLFLLCVD